MDINKYRELGFPRKETHREKVIKLTEQVFHIVVKKYKGLNYDHDNVFDTIEAIIKEELEYKDVFICSQENMSKKIMAVHDMDVAAHSLFIGPFPQYRRTVLEKLAEKITAIIYETGMKEEIVNIMFACILKEMKSRFGHKKSGYIYTGVEGNREEGVIKKK
jgi:hypothetical protein